MGGTTFAEKDAILLTPPKMMMAAANAMMVAKTYVLFSKENALASALTEFAAWTPTNPIPKVMTMRIARTIARGRL